MRASLAKEKGEDGSRLFCWAKRGKRLARDKVAAGEKCGQCDWAGPVTKENQGVRNCNGMLLGVAQIQAFINNGGK